MGRLARSVLESRGIKGEAEVSLLFVDEAAIAALNERFLSRRDRPTCWPSRSRTTRSPGRFPDMGGTGPGTDIEDEPPLLLGDVVVCPSVAERNAKEHSVASRTRSRCWLCTASCTCSAWTTRSTPRPRRWRPSSPAPGRVPPLRVVMTVTGGGRSTRRCWRVIGLLLLGSGVLALAETALVRTSKVKAKALADQHRRGARPLVRLVERPERFLNPILLLVLVCQLVSATLVGVLAEQWFGPIGVVLGTVFEVVVIFVLFEAVPKNWAVHNPESAALFSAPLVATLVRLPPVRAASKVLIGLANLMIGRGKDDPDAPSQGASPSTSCGPWPTWPTPRM